MGLYANKRVILGFFLSIISLLVLALYSYYNNQEFQKSRETVLHTTRVLYHIEQAKSNALRLEELLSWYLLTGDSIFIDDYSEEVKDASVHYLSLKKLTTDNVNQQIRLDSLRGVGRVKLDLHQVIMKTRLDSSYFKIERELEASNRKISLRLNAIINGLLQEENTLLEMRISQSKVEMRRFQTTFASLIGVTLVILIVVFVVVNQTLRAKTIAEQNTLTVNKELEAFTYSVSHDLRAPLRSILGFSQVLKEDYENVLGVEGARVLEKVMRNAKQMGQLIDDLLDFARMGRKELVITTIDTQLQVGEVIHELTEHLPDLRKQITILTLSEIRGDINMMKQVWINLISNALKYTRNCTEPRIEIGNTLLIGQTIFYIRDNGVGFDMRYYEKLFNVFQRLHTTSEFEGTGVGLALVNRIVTRHHGKIWAEAKPNEGATFYFSIPN